MQSKFRNIIHSLGIIAEMDKHFVYFIIVFKIVFFDILTKQFKIYKAFPNAVL